MLDFLTEPATYLSLLSLTLLEIVLGIDNVIFISILAGKLPASGWAPITVVGHFVVG
jgi:predicted tellurium resistance membrane protein TerC